MNDIKNQVQIVLVETSHPGNIGSVARAMKTMGLQNLVLVKPRNFPSKEAFVLSGNAQDLIEQAVVVNTLDEAIKNCTNIYATSARTRSISWPIITAEMAGIEINKSVREGTKVSIIFGREDRGLTNEELQKANKHILIPSSEDYPVLNIAMSVQVIAYEIFKNADIEVDINWQDYPELNSEELSMLIDHFIDTSYKLNLFDEDNAKKILVRIKRMFTRLKPDKMEGNFLRGFLTRINKKIK
tara:strand:+ start:3902 stop:4627 length:726 start_codon:yes stop_codon:yes gene_type:complete